MKTPVREMEKTADVQPLDTWRNYKALCLGEKMKRLTSHPLHSKLEGCTKNRLKQKSLNHLTKELQTPLLDILERDPKNCEPLLREDWKEEEIKAETDLTTASQTQKKKTLYFFQEVLAPLSGCSAWVYVHVNQDQALVSLVRLLKTNTLKFPRIVAPLLWSLCFVDP